MEGYRRFVIWKPSAANSKVLQIYFKGLEYALVSKDYEQCHPFVWCKDFLHDVIHAATHYLWFEVYKFKYNPQFDPLPCLDRTRLLLANAKDKTFQEKVPAVLDFINQIEESLKMKPSFARDCWFPPEGYEKSGVVMIEGSRRWINAPPMLSLYSLLLRVGFVHTPGDPFMKTIRGVMRGDIKPYQKKDHRWLQSVEPALEKILRLGDRRIFYRSMASNYPRHLQIDTIHNRLGIVGFAADMAYKSRGEPVLVPYWHYQK
jgi:hypothetical protein